jgi:PAS domain S-box-containing protein
VNVSLPIRVLVAEDEEPLRTAICDLIAGEPGFEIVAVADSTDSAIEQAGKVKPDVALLDVRMPGGGGPRAAREIQLVSPGTRSVALSAYDDRASVVGMIGAGAIAYVLKGDRPDEITEAIRRAARGQGSLPAEIVTELVADLEHESTARAEVLDVLKRSESRFRSLVELAPDAVTITAVDGEIVLVNEQTERLFGYTRGELVGQSIYMLVPRRLHDEYRRVRTAFFVEPAERPSRERFQFVGLRKDRSEFSADISLSAIETDDGVQAVALIRDTTGRSAAETTLSRTDQPVEVVLETAPIGVVILDDRDRIEFVNGQTEKMFGYDRADLLGNAVEVVLPELFHDRRLTAGNGYVADSSRRPTGADLDLTGRRRDGTEFPVEVTLAPIESAMGGRVAAFVRGPTEREARAEKVRGIADRRDALARLVSAGEEERRKIAGDIHDDSIQVMTATGMRVQILRRLLNDPEQLSGLDELEKMIQLSISRLRHLIFELRPPVLDNEGLAAALRVYLDVADETSGTVYALDDRLKSQPSEANRVVLYRIAQEVLTNVRKHAVAPNASVTLKSRDGGTSISIRDDGVGFEPDLDSIRPGHLGLAAIRERAELAGGWLRVHSAPTKGTTVEFWIGEDSGVTAAAGVVA